MKRLLMVPLFFYAVVFAHDSVDHETYYESEALSGFYVDGETVSFIVTSYGCTTVDDFELEIAQSYPVQLKLIRTAPDFCKAMPADETISFTLSQLGLSAGEAFYVNNEFVALMDF